MNKEFIPYKQALELKELGFDEPCLGFYDYYTKGVPLEMYDSQSDCSGQPAPIYQQAFRWFREKYGLNYKIEEVSQIRFQGRVYKGDGWATWDFGYKFNTYEEAELACLKKLIELIKQKP